MNMVELVSVVAMAMILEGLFPFILPERWRATVVQVARLETSQIRMMGAVGMLIGAVVLFIVRGVS